VVFIHALFGEWCGQAVGRFVGVEAAQVALLADFVGMPDLLVQQHVQVAHAQGAQAHFRRNM